MIPPPRYPKAKGTTVPPLLAAALLAVCGGIFLNPKPPDSPSGTNTPTTTLSPVPAAEQPRLSAPPTPAERHPTSPHPGVLSLPPATLTGNYTIPPPKIHQAPPPSASRDTFTIDDLKAQLPQRASGTFAMEVPTLSFSAGDAAARQVIEGQSIETTAQITSRPSNPACATLSRSLTRCCASDARSYTLTAELPTPHPLFPDGAWVTVTGTLHYTREIGDFSFSPMIRVLSMQMVPPPAQTVLQ